MQEKKNGFDIQAGRLREVTSSQPFQKNMGACCVIDQGASDGLWEEHVETQPPRRKGVTLTVKQINS